MHEIIINEWCHRPGICLSPWRWVVYTVIGNLLDIVMHHRYLQICPIWVNALPFLLPSFYTPCGECLLEFFMWHVWVQWSFQFTLPMNVGNTSMFVSHHLDFRCLECKLTNVVPCHKGTTFFFLCVCISSVHLIMITIITTKLMAKFPIKYTPLKSICGPLCQGWQAGPWIC